MLNNISQWFHVRAKGWLVLVLFFVYAFFAGYVMPMMATNMNVAAGQNVTPLDLLIVYTPEQAYAMMENYGETGRDVYLNIELTADIVYPISTMLFFCFFLSWLFQRGFKPESVIQKFNIMPLGSWVFDLIENAAIVPMIVMYPTQSNGLAWAAILLGIVKWGFAFLSIGFVLYGLARAAINGFKKKV